MNTKTLFIIVGLLVVAGGAYMMMGSKDMSSGDTMAVKSDVSEASMKDEGTSSSDMEDRMNTIGEDAQMAGDSDMGITEGEGEMMDEKKEVMGDEVAGEEEMMEKKAGTYEPYTQRTFELTEGDVVLFFKASWCPSCRTLDESIKSDVAGIPEGVTILEVDYDANQDLRAQYGVTSQHTLVHIDADGNVVKKWNSSRNLDEVLEMMAIAE
jgi:thiol-disulfide isomerase/thioredoxin